MRTICRPVYILKLACLNKNFNFQRLADSVKATTAPKCISSNTYITVLLVNTSICELCTNARHCDFSIVFFWDLILFESNLRYVCTTLLFIIQVKLKWSRKTRAFNKLLEIFECPSSSLPVALWGIRCTRLSYYCMRLVNSLNISDPTISCDKRLGLY